MTEWWWNEKNNHLRPKKEGGPALASFRSERKREVYPPIPLCRGGWVDRLHASFRIPIPVLFLTFPWSFISIQAWSQSTHPPLQRGMGRLTPRFLLDSHPWLIPFISCSFLHSLIIHLNISVKSIRPSPSAEGDGWIDSTLPFEFQSLFHSLHSLLIPSFLDHSSQYKLEVNPPIPLYRGG